MGSAMDQHHESTAEEQRLRAEVAVLQYKARSRGALLQANAFLDAQSTNEYESRRNVTNSPAWRTASVTPRSVERQLLAPRPGRLYYRRMAGRGRGAGTALGERPLMAQ